MWISKLVAVLCSQYKYDTVLHIYRPTSCDQTTGFCCFAVGFCLRHFFIEKYTVYTLNPSPAEPGYVQAVHTV